VLEAVLFEPFLPNNSLYICDGSRFYIGTVKW